MTKSTRLRYDSAIPYLYATGREELIPEYIRNDIPDPNKTRWRKMSPDRFSQGEFRVLLEGLAERAELNVRLSNYRKLLYGMTRLALSLKPLVQVALSKKIQSREVKAAIVFAVKDNEQFIPPHKALRYLEIPSSTFHEWNNDLKHLCSKSPTTKCVRRRPRQVSGKELRKMKRMLMAKRYQYWPISSICYYASRAGILHLSMNTWYKYARVLGIKRKAIRPVRKTLGIQADCSNQIWHMDVTYFATNDGKNYYIYEVVDNFSRYILAWTISERLSMHHTREVLDAAVKVSNEWHDHMNISLVVDGGSENFNKEVSGFLKKNSYIKRLKARKDIKFSNSRIEAVHKILKSRYLRSKPLPAFKQLNNMLRKAINDYNETRPHHANKGFTPFEIYSRLIPDFDFSLYRKEAAQKRVEQHRCVNCICNGFGKCQKE